jgi:hypothetical protein
LKTVIGPVGTSGLVICRLDSEKFVPVTPTITRGWAAKTEKTTEPRTEARRTSLTPKLMSVLVNISSEKARAGKILE